MSAGRLSLAGTRAGAGEYGVQGDIRVTQDSCSPATRGLEQRCLVEPSVALGVGSLLCPACSHEPPGPEHWACGRCAEGLGSHGRM